MVKTNRSLFFFFLGGGDEVDSESVERPVQYRPARKMYAIRN